MNNLNNNADPISIFEEIFPGDTNAYGTAFGGKILSYMDRAAGLAASRYAKCNFVTASLDAMEFRGPVVQGEIAEVEAKVVYTSKHTCGVKVRVHAVEKTKWIKRDCCEGIFFMVAVDENSKTVPVRQFSPGSDQERSEWNTAKEIHQAMLLRQKKRKS
jgi:acyl-CoA hydrolase